MFFRTNFTLLDAGIMKSLHPKDAAKIYGVSQASLLNWERQGLLKPTRTPGGHRRYTAAQIEELMRAAQKPDPRSTQFTMTFRSAAHPESYTQAVTLRVLWHQVSPSELAKMLTPTVTRALETYFTGVKEYQSQSQEIPQNTLDNLHENTSETE